MPDEETMICYCHDVTLGELAKYIKENDIQEYMQIVKEKEFYCGDTCKNCHEDGYNNDGFSLAMAVGMVKRGYV